MKKERVEEEEEEEKGMAILPYWFNHQQDQPGACKAINKKCFLPSPPNQTDDVTCNGLLGFRGSWGL